MFLEKGNKEMKKVTDYMEAMWYFKTTVDNDDSICVEDMSEHMQNVYHQILDDREYIREANSGPSENIDFYEYMEIEERLINNVNEFLSIYY